MDKNCKICGRHQSLCELRFYEDDTDVGKEWSTYVCATCWDIIATIAVRAAAGRLEVQYGKVVIHKAGE